MSLYSLWLDDTKQLSMKKDKLEKLLKECWDAADEYREQLDRIWAGNSNYDKPTYPDKKTWINTKMKELK